MLWGSIRFLGTLIALVFLAEIFWSERWLVWTVELGFCGLVICVRDKKLGKMRSTIDGPWRPPLSYGRSGPHPRQQSTQQSTNIIWRVYIVKTRKKIITSNITINARRIDNNERRWRCSNSNATMGAVQPARWYRQFRRRGDAPNDIFDEGWRGGGRGGGCGWVMLLRLKKRWGHWGCNGRTIFFVWWLVRQWKIMVTIWY